MSIEYQQLIDAAIQHLEQLQTRGARFVQVAPATLAALGRPPQSESRPVRPAGLPAAARSTAQSRPELTTLSTPAANLDTASTKLSPLVEPRAKLDSATRAKAMQDLRDRAVVCVKCQHLANSRKNVVFGVGTPDAELMFVGEAPGAEEDEQGEPFVGAAGQLLTRIIQTMGLSRDRVYIANILKCRPDTPGQSSGNRKPTAEEMKTCIPYLHSQIDLIQPRILVALGGTAVEGLLGKTVGITRLRGNWQVYRGIPLMPTFHPSYLLRSTTPLPEKRKVWEDMLQVMEKLGLAISEKQRRFFLPGKPDEVN